MKLSHFSEEDWIFISVVYELACKAHSWQLRKNGKPYIVHPKWSLLILLNELLDEDEIPDAITIATMLCHDIIEDCPDFREELYVVSPQLFWKVANQSDLSKVSVRDYIVWKVSNESIKGLIDPILSYNLFASRCTFFVNRVLNLVRSPIQAKKFYEYYAQQWWDMRLNITKLLSLSEIELKMRIADGVYNMRDRRFLLINPWFLGKFSAKIDFSQAVLSPRVQSLVLSQVETLLGREESEARRIIAIITSASSPSAPGNQ